MADKEDAIPMGNEEPLKIEGDESSAPAAGSMKIQAFGRGAMAAGRREVQFKRPLNVTGAGATRCRMFHSKVTLAALEYLVNQINEWLDGDKIEIKHISEVVGVMEGKNPEPNVIVLVWY